MNIPGSEDAWKMSRRGKSSWHESEQKDHYDAVYPKIVQNFEQGETGQIV